MNRGGHPLFKNAIKLAPQRNVCGVVVGVEL